MPRQTEKQATELSLLDTIETLAIIPGDKAQQKERDQLSESLLLAYSYSSSFRYLERRLYTDRIARFDQFIYGESDAAFLATFRMSRPTFWKLIDLLTTTGGLIWRQSLGGPGRQARPIYQQIASALYVLSDSGSSGERNRLQINTTKGSVLNYIDRTIRALDFLVPTVIS